MTATDKNTEQQVRSKITVITFWLSLLVIRIHTYNLETYGIDGTNGGFDRFVWFIETTWASLCKIAVPFFFFVSGYLFFRTFKLSWDGLRSKYISRVKGIVIPYIIWCTIYYLYYVVMTNVPYVSRFVSSDKVPLSLMKWLDALWVHEYYTLWFLKSIILLVLICPLIYFLLTNRYVGAVVMIAVLVNSHFGFVKIPISGHEYYMAGAYIALSFKGFEYCKRKLFTILACLFLAAMAVLRFSLIGNIFINIIFFVAVWFALDLASHEREFPWWMKITFFTYVAHDMLLEMLEKVVLLVFGRGHIFALLDYVFMPFVTFAILVAVAAFMRRFLPGVWRVITGSRE